MNYLAGNVFFLVWSWNVHTYIFHCDLFFLSPSRYFFWNTPIEKKTLSEFNLVFKLMTLLILKVMVLICHMVFNTLFGNCWMILFMYIHNIQKPILACILFYVKMNTDSPSWGSGFPLLDMCLNPFFFKKVL